MPKAAVNGININYKVQGKGEPLVLIMGYAGDQMAWIRQTGAFKAHHRVLTFDNRGVGMTDKPKGAYSARTMADDTVGLMDNLGIEKAHILGVSMGGMIAQEIAINYPERVDRLILGCTSAVMSEQSGIAPELLGALGLGKGFTDEDVRRIPIFKLVSILCSRGFNRVLYRIVLLPLLKIQVRRIGAVGLAGQLEAVMHHNTFERLAMIGAPTLVITGTADRVIMPSSSKELVKMIPKAQLATIHSGSHSFNLERSKEFNTAVLDFLRGN